MSDRDRSRENIKMPAMRTYRCYLLDYHIAAVEVMDCADDDEARQRADALLAQRPDFKGVEVWERDRRVHMLLVAE
jgi:hypothetical protein